VPYFAGQSNVLDVGCGRGEFLELLKDKGISAKGLDLNPEMIEVCKSRGLDAAAGDARSYLKGLPDESLGGLIAVQVIEHLQPPYLTEMLALAFDKVRPGGKIVLETINPSCWVAFFESFIRDLTHVKPIHPETLQYLLQANGFSNVEIVYRAPIAPEGRLQRVSERPAHFGDTAPDALTELVSSFNQNVDRLNDRMFSYQDFAAIDSFTLRRVNRDDWREERKGVAVLRPRQPAHLRARHERGGTCKAECDAECRHAFPGAAICRPILQAWH